MNAGETTEPLRAGRNELPLPSQSPRQRVRVQVLQELHGLAALRPEWEALLAKSGGAVFSSWEWLFTWQRRMGAARIPWVMVARTSEGELAGLLPLVWRGERALGRKVRILSFMGDCDVGSDYLDCLALPGHEEAVASAFFRTLVERQPAWDVLDLKDLRAESSTLERLLQSFPRPQYVRIFSGRYTCPFETLSPAEPFDLFLRRTGRRDNYLRRLKWLEKQPGFRIEKTEEPAKLPRVMGEFFRLHSLRWEGDGGSQGIRGAQTEAFHRDAAELLSERGRIRFYTLWVGEKAVASVYGMIHRNTFIYYQAGYDPAWRSKSVGLVLVGETFKDALLEGLTEYDFLRGTESYKSDWTTQTRETVQLRILKAGGPGEWLERAENWGKIGRDTVKRLLPNQLTERIRRLRRRLA